MKLRENSSQIKTIRKFNVHSTYENLNNLWKIKIAANASHIFTITSHTVAYSELPQRSKTESFVAISNGEKALTNVANCSIFVISMRPENTPACWDLNFTHILISNCKYWIKTRKTMAWKNVY